MISSDTPDRDADPVIGCEDPDTAIRRAEVLLGDDSTGVFWLNTTRRLLRAFLWAAAVDGRTVDDVADWARRPQDTTAARILREHADTAPAGWLDDVQHTQGTGGMTVQSVYTMLATILPPVVAGTRCPSGRRSVQPCGPRRTDGPPTQGRIVSAHGAHESDPGCGRHLAELLLVWDEGDEPAVVTDVAPAEGEALAAYVYELAAQVSRTLYILYGDADDETPAHVRALSRTQWDRAIGYTTDGVLAG
jgi:hypothetical protein